MRHVRKLLAIASASAAFAFAVPANAVVLVGSGDAGTAYVVDFTGQVGGNTETGLSSLLTLTFNGTSNGGLTYNFNYDLLNDSSLVSRLRSFGFDVSGALNSATATGVYDNVEYADNFPEGVGTLDLCFRVDGGNVCTGGPNGLLNGQSASGSLSLTFNSALASLTMDRFTTRYQSIELSQFGDSGVGLGTPAVPEPGTWALMLIGFGAIGWGMRRRKPSGHSQLRVRYI